MDKSKTISRYDRKREQILEAATNLMNEQGAAALTLRDVAKAVRLTPATLAYYFKKKENLVDVLYQRRMDALENLISEASRQEGLSDRVNTFLTLEISRLERVAREEAPNLSVLPSNRSMDHYPSIRKQVVGLWHKVEGFWEGETNKGQGDLVAARAYMLMGILFYLPTWITQYPVEEYGRICAKIMDVLEAGIANESTNWKPQIFSVDDDLTEVGTGIGKMEFMRAATRLLNTRGYNGTSVDSISDELNVTKGSFYHHIQSKDEIIENCIMSNFERISKIISLSKKSDGDNLRHLGSAVATILSLQFEQNWPLLRSTAFATLPAELRSIALTQSNQIALRFASLLIDGIGERSVRMVDPLISSHIISSALYSALGLQAWAQRLPRERAVALYASTLMHGILGKGSNSAV